ncbi:MAG: COP23 domain-containing protein [Calothrix sp. MO_192.B10]|nr:COP23 domain-containing protein [Calothrix sp. MO_192.B10]
MSKTKHLFDGINLTIGIIGAVVGIVGLALAYAQFTGWRPDIFPPNTRFSCALLADTQKGGEVWTVMYRNNQKKKPWLRMVNTFGDGWNTRKRCDKITDRLENFRQDGLVEFSHRPDPNTPNQSVICAITRLDSKNCNLLVTLKPGADGYESLKAMTEALRNGTSVDQGYGNITTSNGKISTVNIENLLDESDR